MRNNKDNVTSKAGRSKVTQKIEKRSHVQIPGHITVLDSDPILYQCNVCKRRFKTEIHIKSHASCKDSEKPITCYQCGQDCISKSDYDEHLRGHTGERDWGTFRPEDSPKCGKGTKRTVTTTRHMRSHRGDKFEHVPRLKTPSPGHNAELPIASTSCDSKFKSAAQLKNHEVNDKNERFFNCDQCEKSFNSKLSLDLHQKTHSSDPIHSAERPFQCDNCSVSFKTKSILDRHIKYTHNKMDEYLAKDTPKLNSGQNRKDTTVETLTAPEEIVENTALNNVEDSEVLIPGAKAEVVVESRPEGENDTTAVSRLTKRQPNRHLSKDNPTEDLPERIACAMALMAMAGTKTSGPSTQLPEDLTMNPNEASASSASKSQSLQLETEKPSVALNGSCAKTTVECEKNVAVDAVTEPKNKQTPSNKGDRPFRCNHCEKSFGFKWTLDRHLRTHTNKESFPCDQCSKTFENNEDLGRHLVIHSLPGGRPFKCGVCSVAFRRQAKLEKHVKNVHLNQLLSTAPGSSSNKNLTEDVENEKAAARETSMTSKAVHEVNTNSGNSEESSSVRVDCGQPSTAPPNHPHSTENSESTVVSKHLPVKSGPIEIETLPPKPSVSEMYCRLRGSFEEHLPFSCTNCRERFASWKHLKQHQRNFHRGDRPFRCDECGKRFPLKLTLDLHRKSHSRGRRYPCNQCWGTFSTRNDLRRHSMTHLGERPFRCGICEIGFRRKKHLFKHIETMHESPEEKPQEEGGAASNVNPNATVQAPETSKLGVMSGAVRDPSKTTSTSLSPSEQSVVLEGAQVTEKLTTTADRSLELSTSNSSKTRPQENSDFIQNEVLEVRSAKDPVNEVPTNISQKNSPVSGVRGRLVVCLPTSAPSTASSIQTTEPSAATGPAVCTQSDNSFTGMADSRKDIASHTGDRSFQCSRNQGSYTLQSKLDLPLKTHATERPFTCDNDKCSRAFTNEKDLRRHSKIHSGDRPFQCWMCETAFRWNKNLRRHIQNVHNLSFEDALLIPLNGCGEDPPPSNTAPDTTTGKYVDEARVICTSSQAPKSNASRGHQKENSKTTTNGKSHLIHTPQEMSSVVSAILPLIKSSIILCKQKPKRITVDGRVVETPLISISRGFSSSCAERVDVSSKSNDVCKPSNTGDNSHVVFICEKCGKCLTKMKAVKKHVCFPPGAAAAEILPENPNEFVAVENMTSEVITGTEKSQKKRSPIVIPDHINCLSTNPPMYACKICKRKFKTKCVIKYHEFCATGKKQFQCEECGQGFISKSHFEYHLRTHTGERPHLCTLCGRQFNQMGRLTRHMRWHTGEKPFTCTLCNRSFTSSNGLKSHNLTHTGERPFACKNCDKRFALLNNLRKHEVIHTGERPFICSQCGKSFSLKWSLDLHTKIHSNERSFACDKCSKTFVHKKDLHRHSVVHSGARLFKCCLCVAGFRRKDHLLRHLINQHKKAKEKAKELADGKATG